ncbi:Meiotic Sister-Chromatid recombination aldehyde dehydrogenase [Rhizophlyctis rosea]|nr:Meiotic Sister-Chromatid recombination aldehyde dehydrogenase [Rhizophlyctis rosea]
MEAIQAILTSVSLSTAVTAICVALAAAYLFLNKESFVPVKQVHVEFPTEADKSWKSGEILENPTIRIASDAKKIQCYDPATGRSLGVRTAVTPDEIREAVGKARIAQQSYAKTSFAKRRAFLRTLLEWVTREQERISAVASRDSGKTVVDGSFGEILTTCAKLRWTISQGEKYLAPEYRATDSLVTAHKSARVEYLPLGVMGCIVSWNYPFHNVIGPLISALFSGNACVVKSSEHVAWSSAFFEKAIKAALRVNGLSEDLVTIKSGWADAGEALISSADKITFIGSPTVGKIVMKTASATLTPVVLELGGKDAIIAFDDCDYNQLLDVAMRCTFQNSGQNCAGLERIIVQNGIYEKVVKDLKERIAAIRVGPPLEEQVDVGAMTMPTQLGIIQRLVDDAVAKGARLLTGGKPFIHPRYPKGQFYTPTLIADVTPDMLIAKEEIFGPVLCLYKFNTEQEAIALANCCHFGLGGAVFTLDYDKGERIAKYLKTGMCNINDFGINYLCMGLPFGGVGLSGVDRFSGVEGLRGNTHIRSATTDKFRMFGIRTGLPPPVKFPLSPASEKFQNGLISMAFGLGLAERAQGLKNLVFASLGW